MTLSTDFSKKLGIKYPIMLAPMGTVAGGELAGAVSNAGGLGMIGVGYADPAWLERELKIIRRVTTKPWGVGFINWCITQEVFDLVMHYDPDALMFSFGDMSRWILQAKNKNLPVLCQVHDLASAFQAHKQGADFIVAQGTEAGGHGTGQRTTLSLVRGIKKHLVAASVIAAGGIVDGAGVAASLKLGADGVSMGTRFYATFEAQADYRMKERLIECSGDDTIRTEVFDIIREIDWPKGYTGRAIINEFIAKWHGKEQTLRQHIKKYQEDFYTAQRNADPSSVIVWAGEGIDAIDDVDEAGRLVHRIITETMHHLP